MPSNAVFFLFFFWQINVQQKVITINEGDQFHYGPWGGLCIAHYVNGILRFYRKSRGKKTVVMSWNCVSAADTLKLLAGGTVDITWDGRGKKPMRVKDEHTLAVTHGTTVYYFVRKFVSVDLS